MTSCIFLLRLLVFLCSPVQSQQPVEIKENASFWYVYMEFEESHYLIPEKVGPFMQEIRRQELQSKVQGDLFGIFFDSPVIVEGRGKTWGLGFKIAEETNVKQPLKKQQFSYEKVATTVHQGPFETAMNSFNVLISYLEEHGLEVIGPPLEIWIGNPAQDKPEELKTEILVPVRVKK
jgi:effector-binding domain-containing protein